MVEKSPNAFRTISEVADVIDVPAHVLRFWESKFAQIKPVKRGGGRRYYRPNDIHLIRGIRDLLYSDGMTIKGAQKVLREKGTKHVMASGEAALNGVSLGSVPKDDAQAPSAAEPVAEPAAEPSEFERMTAPVTKRPAKQDREFKKTGLFFDRSDDDPLTVAPNIAAQGDGDASHASQAFQEPPQTFERKKKTSRSDKATDGEIADLFDKLNTEADVVNDPSDLLSVDDIKDAPPAADPLIADSDPGDFAHEDNRKAQLRSIYARLQTLRVAMTDDD